MVNFNDGQYEAPAQLHSRAQQICVVLYPRDATENGKLLQPKQQFFLCNASLQDIIFRFKERKDGGSCQWSEFPNKVAVQLNDTHPTLAIPELMRLLMNDEGFGWDEAWDMTSRVSVCSWWINGNHIQTSSVRPAKRPTGSEFWNCYGISRAFNGDTDLLPVSFKGAFAKEDNSNSSWGLLQHGESRKTEKKIIGKVQLSAHKQRWSSIVTGSRAWALRNFRLEILE